MQNNIYPLLKCLYKNFIINYLHFFFSKNEILYFSFESRRPFS